MLRVAQFDLRSLHTPRLAQRKSTRKPGASTHVPEAVDWTRGYESLDKELHRIMPEAEVGNRLADMLFKVWLKDGQETWLLIHIEVQAQPDEAFPRRMFVYYYRLFDLYNQGVLSLAVLCDDRPDWQPNQFAVECFGCKVSLEFPLPSCCVIEIGNRNSKRVATHLLPLCWRT